MTVRRRRTQTRNGARIPNTTLGPAPTRPALFVAPALDLPAIRATAQRGLDAAAKAGITNPAATTILTLCDHIERHYPWRAVELRNAARRTRARARWQRRPPMRAAGLAWADDHRPAILEHWHASRAEVDGIANADLWIIPRPGETHAVRLCPACGNVRERRRHCAECEGKGTITVEIPT